VGEEPQTGKRRVIALAREKREGGGGKKAEIKKQGFEKDITPDAGPE